MSAHLRMLTHLMYCIHQSTTILRKAGLRFFSNIAITHGKTPLQQGSRSLPDSISVSVFPERRLGNTGRSHVAFTPWVACDGLFASMEPLREPAKVPK